MAKVISLEERRLLKTAQGDLNASVAQILEMTRKFSAKSDAVLPYSSLSEWLGGAISQEIIRREQMSEEIFLCGLYIAAILARVGCDLKKYAVDFLEKWSASSDPEFLKMGGDFCFVLCGGFAGRCERRMMRLRDYEEMGASFYDWFYSSTGKVIGHYMSVNFGLMQDIVKSIISQKSCQLPD